MTEPTQTNAHFATPALAAAPADNGDTQTGTGSGTIPTNAPTQVTEPTIPDAHAENRKKTHLFLFLPADESEVPPLVARLKRENTIMIGAAARRGVPVPPAGEGERALAAVLGNAARTFQPDAVHIISFPGSSVDLSVLRDHVAAQNLQTHVASLHLTDPESAEDYLDGYLGLSPVSGDQTLDSEPLDPETRRRIQDSLFGGLEYSAKEADPTGPDSPVGRELIDIRDRFLASASAEDRAEFEEAYENFALLPEPLRIAFAALSLLPDDDDRDAGVESDAEYRARVALENADLAAALKHDAAHETAPGIPPQVWPRPVPRVESEPAERVGSRAAARIEDALRRAREQDELDVIADTLPDNFVTLGAQRHANRDFIAQVSKNDDEDIVVDLLNGDRIVLTEFFDQAAFTRTFYRA